MPTLDLSSHDAEIRRRWGVAGLPAGIVRDGGLESFHGSRLAGLDDRADEHYLGVVRTCLPVPDFGSARTLFGLDDDTGLPDLGMPPLSLMGPRAREVA